MKVSVIIVNFNTKDITEKCISSIYRHTKNVALEVVLVDNASSDGSQEYFRSFPDIIFIESNENIGFGRANNLGAGVASGEFLFFLNSDTLLIENSIEKMLEFFLKNESSLKIGVLGCLLVGADLKINGFGSSFPTVQSELAMQWRRIPFLKNYSTTENRKRYNIDGQYFEIDYVIGADMMMRRSLFKKMDGFYKGFFMYFEETDLQNRIRNFGLRNFIFAGTKIIHLEEASGNVIKNYSNKKRIITHKSRLLYLKRRDPAGFYKFAIIDFMFLMLNLFNGKYTFGENFLYLKNGVRSYFSK